MCMAAGRIFLHGFFLTGYLPLSLDPCVTFYLLTEETPCHKTVIEGYMKYLGGVAEEAITSLRAVDGDFDPGQRLMLLSHLHEENLETTPKNKEELDVLLYQLGRFNLLIKPHYILRSVSRCSANNFTRNVGESAWQEYFAKLLPTGDLIAQTLTPIFGDDIVLNQLEQTIFSHIERYVREMDTSKAQLFLKFVTGCETLQQPISIIFNSMEQEQQILPKAHTCSCKLELSRFTPSYSWLCTTMDNILSGSYSRSGFQFV